MTSESPSEAGRRWAQEHAKTHPLTDEQVEAAARIIAEVIREKWAEKNGPLLTADDVAERLHVKPGWVRVAALRENIASRKIGRRRLFTEDDVAEYLEKVKSCAADPWARGPRSSVERELMNRGSMGSGIPNRSRQSQAAFRREARKRGEL